MIILDLETVLDWALLCPWFLLVDSWKLQKGKESTCQVQILLQVLLRNKHNTNKENNCRRSLNIGFTPQFHLEQLQHFSAWWWFYFTLHAASYPTNSFTQEKHFACLSPPFLYKAGVQVVFDSICSLQLDAASMKSRLRADWPLSSAERCSWDSALFYKLEAMWGSNHKSIYTDFTHWKGNQNISINLW